MVSLSQSTIGWAWVGFQVILFAGLLLLPPFSPFGIPDWLRQFGSLLTIAGFILLFVSAFNLGTALTPTPVPKKAAGLKTNGLYALMRHPIYTAVMLIIGGIIINNPAVSSLVLGALSLPFFISKSQYEEGLLSTQYPEYKRYAAVTGRFLPKIRRQHANR